MTHTTHITPPDGPRVAFIIRDGVKSYTCPHCRRGWPTMTEAVLCALECEEKEE